MPELWLLRFLSYFHGFAFASGFQAKCTHDDFMSSAFFLGIAVDSFSEDAFVVVVEGHEYGGIRFSLWRTNPLFFFCKSHARCKLVWWPEGLFGCWLSVVIGIWGKYKLGPDVMPVLVQAAPLGGGGQQSVQCPDPLIALGLRNYCRTSQDPEALAVRKQQIFLETRASWVWATD